MAGHAVLLKDGKSKFSAPALDSGAGGIASRCAGGMYRQNKD
jgi:hypothetical protein